MIINASLLSRTVWRNWLPVVKIYAQDNVFIMSNPKSKFPVLQLDLRLEFLLLPPVLLRLLHLVLFNNPSLLVYHWQIDIWSSCCDCLCNLWWNCLCLCWTTGQISSIELCPFAVFFGFCFHLFSFVDVVPNIDDALWRLT